jgi:hypothetical protein
MQIFHVLYTFTVYFWCEGADLHSDDCSFLSVLAQWPDDGWILDPKLVAIKRLQLACCVWLITEYVHICVYMHS